MEKSKDTQGVFVDVMAVFFFALGVFTFVSLLVFSNLLEIDVKGTMGDAGLYMSHSLGSSFGTLSFVFPVLMFYASYVILRKRPAEKIYWKLFSTIIFLLSSTTLLGLIYGKSSLLGYSPAGGWLGLAISREFAQNILGTFGTYIVAIIVVFLSVIITTETKIASIVKTIRLLCSALLKGVLAPIGALRRAAARRKLRKKKKQDAPKATPSAARAPATPQKRESDGKTEAEPQIVFTPPTPDKKNRGTPSRTREQLA